MEMEMEMVMVIFGAPKASSVLRFASKRLLTSDFEVLEASGAPKGDQESPKTFPGSLQEAPEKPLRGPQEAPWRCFGSSWRSKKLPKPRSSIHSSVSEPPRTLPEVPKSRSIDPVDVLEPPEGGPHSYAIGWAGPGRPGFPGRGPRPGPSPGSGLGPGPRLLSFIGRSCALSSKIICLRMHSTWLDEEFM